ncbi:hypothetical protein [Brachyspira sp.]|uniref:hypothetical protein n=1 Tax=Brachyspira sp. TaxID=1977261 RepID=UPI003D7E9868
MRNITKIFTLVLSLILLFAVSCSNDDKTGVPNNPPENDTEIKGDSGSGGSSETETGGSGSGSETGGSGTGGSGTETGGGSGTGTGGDSGSGTGTGGDSGSGTGTGGSGEGGGGTETPPTPSETETTEEGYFPPPEGKYKSDARRWEPGFGGSYMEPEVSTIDGKTKIYGDLILHDSNESRNAKFNVSKWKKTTKDGKITKTEAVEIEPYKIIGNGKYETPTFTEVIYDYETKTLSITCKVTMDGIEKTLSTKSEKY